jgi:hypothetical protein
VRGEAGHGCELGGADGSEEWRGIRRQTRVQSHERVKPRERIVLSTNFFLHFILFRSRDDVLSSLRYNMRLFGNWHYCMATYQVETNLSMQIMETSIWVTRYWSNGDLMGGGRGDLQNHICKSHLPPLMNFVNHSFHLPWDLRWINIVWLTLKFP